MSSGSEKFRFQEIMEEFMREREWEDALVIDEEKKEVALNTGVSIGEYDGGRLIIEADEELEWFSVFFYLPFSCKQTKRTEMCLLLNDINLRGNNFGCFQLLDDNRIRWVLRSDFEGSSPTSKSVHQMVGVGWNRTKIFIEVISSVALTKQTAVLALEEFDAEEEEKKDSEGPSEL